MMRRFIEIVRNKLNVSSNTLSIKRTRQTSLGALRMIYYVIIGLAIGEALSKTFLDQKGNFLGKGIVVGNNLPAFLLLVAFLFTIVRFVHGASVLLEMDRASEKQGKLLCDFGGFVLHASVFYLMAVSLKEIPTFLVSFGLMLLLDALWIIFICCKKYIKLEGTSLKWLISDFVIINLLWGVWVKSRGVTSVGPAVAILIIAIMGTLADYSWNRRFYFPIENMSQK